MAYKTEELEAQAVKAIIDHDLIFIEDVIAHLPCSKPTFYDHGLNESDNIKRELLRVRTTIKKELRKKWRGSDNAILQMGLYKLIGSGDELERLGQKVEVSGNKDKPVFTGFQFAKQIANGAASDQEEQSTEAPS